MKIISQSSDELVLKEGGTSGIVVGIANVPTPPPVTNPPPTVTLNGDVVSPGTAYTVSDVQALPVSTQTDTFLQGSTPKTFTFTGTPLIAGEERTREVFGDYVSVYNFAASAGRT